MGVQKEQVWGWDEDLEFGFEHVKILLDIRAKTLSRQLDIRRVQQGLQKIGTPELYLGIGNI